MMWLARRIVDRRVLHLIKMWLDCPVEETDKRDRKTRTTEARDNRRGIPQGSPISPLLANLYMRRFVLGWKKLGLERSLGTRLNARSSFAVTTASASSKPARPGRSNKSDCAADTFDLRPWSRSSAGRRPHLGRHRSDTGVLFVFLI
jgi:hypothetical protein